MKNKLRKTQCSLFVLLWALSLTGCSANSAEPSGTKAEAPVSDAGAPEGQLASDTHPEAPVSDADAGAPTGQPVSDEAGAASAGEVTSEEDYAAAYSTVISKYQSIFESGKNQDLGSVFEQDLSELCESSAHVGYALKDLDDNGIPELIVAGIDTDEYGKDIVFEICTLEDGSPVRILISYARDRYYLREDNCVVNEGSSGAAYMNVNVYRVSGSSLVPAEAVMTYPVTEEQIGFFYQEGSFSYEPRDTDPEITEEEFNAKWDEYKSGVYLPALTEIA